MLRLQKILHPTDFSDPAREAFRLACALARHYHAEIVILHVAAPPPVVAYGEVVPTVSHPPGYHDWLWQELRKIQPDDPALTVSYQLLEGDAAKEIVKFAQQMGADLIVMGTHGRTGLMHLLMGSVAEEVVRHATCPVLTVRAKRQPSG